MTDSPAPEPIPMFDNDVDLSARRPYVDAELERIARLQKQRWETESLILSVEWQRSAYYLLYREQGKHDRAQAFLNHYAEIP